MRYPFLGLWLLCFGSLQATTGSDTNEPRDILTYEEYASIHSGESYFLYLDHQLFGTPTTENEIKAEASTFVAPLPVEPEPCPDIDYVICDDFGPLITNGIVYRDVIDSREGSLPFCLIEGKECFDMDGVSLHGRPTSTVFFDVYNFEFDPSLGCEFNFFFTEQTDTRHFKAFIGLCSYTEDGLPTFTCVGDTESSSSIPVTCDMVGESTMPQFWTVVIAGLSWEKYAFKIKPDSPCSNDEITPILLEETSEPGVRQGSVENLLGLEGNDFVNRTRLDALGDEIEVQESSLEAADVYGDAYASTGCGAYQGEDRIYTFTVEDGINEVTIDLDNRGSGEPLGMFLYNYLCTGQQPLDFAEVGVEGGSTSINISLRSGVYFLIVDNDITGDWGAHRLFITTKATLEVTVPPSDNLEDCPDEKDPDQVQEDKLHSYNIQVDTVQLSNYPNHIGLKDQPNLYFFAGYQRGFPTDPFFIRRQKRVTYSPLYITKEPWEPGDLITIDLFEDNKDSREKCGFSVSDSIYLRTLVVPNVGKGANSSQFMKVRFDNVLSQRPPGKFLSDDAGEPLPAKGSTVDTLETEPCVLTFFGAFPNQFNAFPPDGGPGTVRVQTNRRWEVYKSEEFPWITIDLEDMGSDLGDAEINFTVDPNDGDTDREGEFLVFGIDNFITPGNDSLPSIGIPDTIFIDTVRINQFFENAINLDIAFSDFWIDCDAPRAKLSAVGCIGRPGVDATWEITPLFPAGEDFDNNVRRGPTTTIEGGPLIRADLTAGAQNEIKLTVTDIVSGNSTTIDTTFFVPTSGGPKISCKIWSVETCTYDPAFMVNLKIKGGLEPYTIEWSHGATDAIIPELPAGWYGITVTDANGCQAKKSLDLEEDHYCPGGMIGEDQKVCGPVGDPGVIESLEYPGEHDPVPAEYHFFWKKSTDLCSEFYSPGQEKWVVIPNAKGETLDPGPIEETTYYRRFATKFGESEAHPSNVVKVEVVPSVGVSLPSRKTSCDGEPIELTASVSGGTAPFTLSWSNGLGGGLTQVVNPSKTTDYSVTVTDANGCSATALSRITVKPNPTIKIIANNGLNNLPFVCLEGSITLIADASLGTTTPTWTTTGAGTLSSTTGSEVIYTPVAADLENSPLVSFTATTEDVGNACTPATDQIEIRIFTPDVSEFCGPASSGFITKTGNPGQGTKSSDQLSAGLDLGENGTFHPIMDNVTYDGKEMQLYQNTPNPFKGNTIIGFALPQKSFWTLTIQNNIGQILKTFEGNGDKGYHQINLKNTDLTPGLYYYVLEAQDIKLTKKMIINE